MESSCLQLEIRGRAASCQLRAACKPRGSEKRLEEKQALLKASYRERGLAHPTGSKQHQGSAWNGSFVPEFAVSWRSAGESKPEAAMPCWDAVW